MTRPFPSPLRLSSAVAGTLLLATLPLAGLGAQSAPSSTAAAPSPGAAPVDDAALLEADPREWVTHGGDYFEDRFSPLDRIDASNVHHLEAVWSYEVEGTDGRLEATPLISDGVLYGTGTWSVVFAVDARTGEELWRWDPAIVRGGHEAGGPSICCGPVNRGVALYEGKVYAGLLDGRLVALDAETGEPVWVRQTVPPGSEYAITQAPRIVKGNVIIGNSGAEYGVRGYVSAYDAETGEMAWRSYTVPGNPADGFESPAMERAAETWAGEWWELGGGGTVWDGMAYDPELDLLYVGTGNGAPWSREHRSDGRGDNLYLASILALDPDDGSLVWHYQTVPGDDWDYTATQNLILADLEIDGEERPVIMQAPKNGFFYVLDRRTGELISAEAFTDVTWATGIDPETGRPIETPEARYDEEGSWLSPGPGGAHNWYPMSWNPETGLVYIPGRNSQSFYRRNPDFEPVPGRFNTGTGGDAPRTVDRPPRPEHPGFLLAWDPVAQEERWRIPYDAPRNGGTLSTGGNLVFSGRVDGWFYAHDATTGEKLWEFEVGPGPGSPVTWELEGRQYVTVMGGRGGSGAEGRVWTFGLDGVPPASAAAGPFVDTVETGVVTRDIDYVPDEDYDDGRDLLDVYMPEEADGVPVLVFFHGGALTFGDKGAGEPLAERMLPHGVGVVSANYRLSPTVEHPGHVRDAAAAVEWVIRNIERYGGDADRVVLAGHSAGAYLATLLAVDPVHLSRRGLDPETVQGTVAISPFLYVEETAPDRPRTVWGDDPEGWVEASVTPHIGPDRGPILLIYADGDDQWRKDQNERFAAAMRAEGSDVRAVEVPNRDHRSLMTALTQADDRIGTLTLEFLREANRAP